MKYSLKILITVSLTLFLCSCKTKSNKQIIITPEQYHASVNKIIDIMIHDIFSPPVASRVFVYPNIAAYEILAQDNPKLLTLDKKLNQFTTIPKVNTIEGVNLKLAALIAHLEISKKLIFSEDKLDHYKDSLYTEWKKINKEQFTITNVKRTTDQITDFLKLTDRGIYQVDPLSRRSASLQMTQHAQNNTIKISKDIMENTENKQYIEIVDQHNKFKTDTYDIDNLLPKKTIVYPSTFCQETLTGLKSGFINIKTE